MCNSNAQVPNGFVQLYDDIFVVKMLMFYQQKHDFQFQMQHNAFGGSQRV